MEEHMIYKVKRLKLLFMTLLLSFVLIIIYFLAGILVESMNKKFYPDSSLNEYDVKSFSVIYETEGYRQLGCPTLPYEVYLPGDVIAAQENTLLLKERDFNIVISESREEIDEALGSTLNMIGLVSMGEPRIEAMVVKEGSGLLNGFLAEYWTGKVSVRNILQEYQQYGVLYRLSEGDGTHLYLYVYTGNKKKLAVAKEYLDTIAWSIMPVLEDEEKFSSDPGDTEEVTEAVDMQKEETGNDIITAPIYHTVYLENAADDGIVLVQWLNSSDLPVNLKVTTPDGRDVYPDMELSYGGHYVYLVGECLPGNYEINGETTAVLRGSLIEILTADYYRSMYIKEE